MSGPRALEPSAAVERVDGWSTASVLGLLVAAVLAPRALVFGFNENWFGDAIVRSELAERWLQHPHWIGSFDQGAFQFGPLHLYLVGLMQWAWGAREHAGRLVSLIASALTVFPLYGLTRRLFGRTDAVVACLGLACWGMHVQFSTTASSEALGLLLVVSAAACFARAFDGDSLAPLAGAAVCLNLACATRYDAWLLVPLWAGSLVWFSSDRRRAFERAVVFAVLCTPFPLVWLLGNYADRGDPLFPLRYIDDFHRRWFPDGEATWGVVPYRLQNLVFWPAVALLTLSPLVGWFGLSGLVTAWRTAPRARWVVVTVVLPAALFTFRSTVTGSFVPLGRFAAKEVLLLLPFVALGARPWLRRFQPSGRRAAVAVAALVAVVLPTGLGLFTFHREGKYADMLRPVSPTSTQPRALMQVAHYLRDQVGPGEEAFILDDDPQQYRDLTLAFFSGFPEERIARYRWEIFEQRVATAQPRVLVLIDGGTLASSRRVRLDGQTAHFGGWSFEPVEGFAAPFHVYRR